MQSVDVYIEKIDMCVRRAHTIAPNTIRMDLTLFKAERSHAMHMYGPITIYIYIYFSLAVTVYILAHIHSVRIALSLFASEQKSLSFLVAFHFFFAPMTRWKKTITTTINSVKNNGLSY